MKQGVQKYSEREKYLLEQKIWPQSKNIEIEENKRFISDLQITLSREFLKSKRDIYKKDIKEVNEKIKNLEAEKEQLIGITAESYANKKSNEYDKNHKTSRL